MTAFRFFVIVVIFSMVSVAWLILGGTITYRTHDLTESLSKEVDALWGPSGLVQEAPLQFKEVVRKTQKGGETREWVATADPLESEIRADFAHASRYKGLIWFSTYTVDFSGTYKIARTADTGTPEEFVFALPSNAPLFENLAVTVDAEARDVATVKNGNHLVIPLPEDADEHVVEIAYRTQARDRWLYDLAHDREESRGHDRYGKYEADYGPGRSALVKKFSLTATTDFREIDYPKGSSSPTPNPARQIDAGMQAEWKFENRSTRQQMGIEMPARTNAGPIAARMAFYAPVSLFFFFTVMFTIVILKRIPLHPMHYLFISAGFFAFHILMAYLVDKIDIHYAFWICAVTSSFLVVTYMRLVAGAKFAVVYVGVAQLVYLVGFSYAFFWVGWTGLAIIIVAIITLFVLMQATGRLDWNEVFKKPPAPSVPPQAPPEAERVGRGVPRR